MKTIALSDFAGSHQQPTLRPLTSLAGNVISPTFSPRWHTDRIRVGRQDEWS